ncbi:MAG: hypothetical protein M1608_08790 [Candidatus Omnitrophica bacterium]|nr:hypothetical protein [Candidatus Omnitrophota bacterium]
MSQGGSHTVKLVNANGTDVTGGSVSVNTASQPTGQFAYASLSTPVILAANTTYYLVSQEAQYGDQWYDDSACYVTNCFAVTTIWPAWANNGEQTYYIYTNYANHSYGPVSFRYRVGTPLVTGEAFDNGLRNNFSGWVGFQFTVADQPMTVTQLGRWVASQGGSHTVKVVNANGTDVTGGSVSVSTSGQPVGRYAYANLAAPLVLSANTTYYLVSQETQYGDQWYDYAACYLTSSGTAVLNYAAYAENGSQTYYVLTNRP